MAISQAMTTSFKIEILQAVHQFGAATISSRGSLTSPSSDTFRMALYTSAATLGASTTAYSATNEVANSGSYAANTSSQDLAISVSPTWDTTNSVSYLSFTDKSWTSATITARGALIYNSTPSANSNANTTLTNAAVAVLDFGSDKTSTAGDFTIIFPTATNTTAILRIA